MLDLNICGNHIELYMNIYRGMYMHMVQYDKT